MPYYKSKYVNGSLVPMTWAEKAEMPISWQYKVNKANSSIVSPVTDQSGFTGTKYTYVPNKKEKETKQYNIANYNDSLEINSLADIIFGTFNKHMKHAGNNAIIKAPILNIIPNTLWHLYSHYLKPMSEGHPSEAIVNALTVEIQEDIDFVDNVIKAVTTPLTNKETTIADIIPNLGKATFFGGEAGRVNFDYDVEVGNAYTNNLINGTLEIATGLIPQLITAWLTGGGSLGLLGADVTAELQQVLGKEAMQNLSEETIQALTKKQAATTVLKYTSDMFSKTLLKATGGLAGGYLGGFTGGALGQVFGDEGEIIGQTLGSFLGQQTLGGVLGNLNITKSAQKYITDIYTKNVIDEYSKDPQFAKIMQNEEVVAEIKNVSNEYAKAIQYTFNKYKNDLGEVGANKKQVTQEYHKQIGKLNESFKTNLISSVGISKYFQGLTPEKLEQITNNFYKTTDRMIDTINTHYRYYLDTKLINSLGFKTETMYNKYDAFPIRVLPYLTKKGFNTALDKTNLALWLHGLNSMLTKKKYSSINPKNFLEMYDITGQTQIVDAFMEGVKYYYPEMYDDVTITKVKYDILHKQARSNIRDIQEYIKEMLSKEYTQEDIKILEGKIQRLLEIFDETQTIETIEDYLTALHNLKNKVIANELDKADDLDFKDTIKKFQDIKKIINKMHETVRSKNYIQQKEQRIVDFNTIKANMTKTDMTIKQLYNALEQTNTKAAVLLLNAQFKMFLQNPKKYSIKPIMKLYHELNIRKSIPASFKKSKFYPRLNALLKEFKPKGNNLAHVEISMLKEILDLYTGVMSYKHFLELRDKISEGDNTYSQKILGVLKNVPDIKTQEDAINAINQIIQDIAKTEYEKDMAKEIQIVSATTLKQLKSEYLANPERLVKESKLYTDLQKLNERYMSQIKKINTLDKDINKLNTTLQIFNIYNPLEVLKDIQLTVYKKYDIETTIFEVLKFYEEHILRIQTYTETKGLKFEPSVNYTDKSLDLNKDNYDAFQNAIEEQNEAVLRFIRIINMIQQKAYKKKNLKQAKILLTSTIHELIRLQDLISNKERLIDAVYKEHGIQQDPLILDIISANIRSTIKNQIDIGDADSVVILKYENFYTENRLLRTATLEKIFNDPNYIELIKSFPDTDPSTVSNTEYKLLKTLYTVYYKRQAFIELYDDVMAFINKDINRKDIGAMFLSVLKQYSYRTIDDIKTNQESVERDIFTSLDRLMWNADRDFKRQNMAALREKYEITDEKVFAELEKAGINIDTQAHEALFDVAAQILVDKAMHPSAEKVQHFDGIMLDIEASGLDIFNSKTTEITAMREVYYTNSKGELDTKLEIVFNGKINGDLKFLQDYKPSDQVLSSMQQTSESWFNKHSSNKNYSEADLLQDFYKTLLQLQGKENIILKTFNGDVFDINFLKQRFKSTSSDLSLKNNSEIARLVQIYFPKLLSKELTFEELLDSFAGLKDIYRELNKNTFHLDTQSTYELKDILEGYIQTLFDLQQHLYTLNNKEYVDVRPMEALDNDEFNTLYQTSDTLVKAEVPFSDEYKTEGTIKSELVYDIRQAKVERIQELMNIKNFNNVEQYNKVIPVKDGFITTLDGHKQTVNQLLMRLDTLMYGYNIYNIDSFKAMFDLPEITYYKSNLKRLKRIQRDILRIRDSIRNTVGIKNEQEIVIKMLTDIKESDEFYEASLIKVTPDFKTNFAFLTYLLNYMEHSKNPKVITAYETIKTEYADYINRLKEVEYRRPDTDYYINPDSDTPEIMDKTIKFVGMHFEDDTATDYFKEANAVHNSVEYTLNKFKHSLEAKDLQDVLKAGEVYETTTKLLVDLQKEYLRELDNAKNNPKAVRETVEIYEILYKIVAQSQLNQLLKLSPRDLLSYILHSCPEQYVTFKVYADDYFGNRLLLKEFLSNKKVLKENYIKVTELEDGRIKLTVDKDAPIVRKTQARLTHYDENGDLVLRSNFSLNGEDLNYVIFKELNASDVIEMFKRLKPNTGFSTEQTILKWSKVRQRLAEICPEFAGRTGLLYSDKSNEKASKNPYLDIQTLDEEYDYSYYFNDSNIGDIASQKEINSQISGNQIIVLGILGNRMLRGSHSYFEYGKYILNGGLRMQDEFIKAMSNQELREYLKNGDYVVAYLTPNKKAIGGFMLRKLNDFSDKLLDAAREKDAVIIDYKTYEIAFGKINKFSISGDNRFFKLWKWYIQNLKRLYLVNGFGVLDRNIIDSSLKNMNDFDDSSELFKYTVKSSKLIMQYTTDLRQIRQMDPYLRYTLENAEKYFRSPKTYKAQLDKETYSMIYDFLTVNGNNSVNTGVHDLFDALMYPNRFFEDTIRFAQYMRMLEQGHTKNHILKEISERHFNYDIKEFLGNAEWGAKLSYVLPFFNFATKNIQYSLKLISENPKLFKQIMNYYGVMWNSEEYDPDELEENTSLQYQIINGNIPLKYLNPFWKDQEITKITETKYGPKEQTVTNTAVLKMGFSLFDAISFFVNPLGNIKEKLAPPIQSAIDTITEFNKHPFSNISANKYNTYEETQEYYKNNFGSSSVWNLLDGDNPDRVKDWLQLIPGGSILTRLIYNRQDILERTNNPALANMSSLFGATSRWGEFKQTTPKSYYYPKKPSKSRYKKYTSFYSKNYATSYRLNGKGQSVKYYLRYPQKVYFSGKVPYTSYQRMLSRIYSPNTAHRHVSNFINSNMQTIPQYLYSYAGRNRQGKSKLLSWARMNTRFKVKSTLRRIATP